MKKLLGIAVLLLASLFAFAGCGSYASQDQMNGVSANVNTLNQQIADLQAQIDALQAQLDGLTPGDNTVIVDNTTIVQIQTDITLLQTQITVLQEQITNLQTTTGDQITYLQIQCGLVKDELAALTARVQALEDALAALGGGRSEGGPAWLFSGFGDPTSTAGARTGDLYIDFQERPGFGYLVWVYDGEEWIKFAYLKKYTGSQAPARLERL